MFRLKSQLIICLSCLLALTSCQEGEKQKEDKPSDSNQEEVTQGENYNTERAKAAIGSPNTKTFWEETVVPILEGDKDRMAEIINFPLQGSWSIDMGFEKTEEAVTKEEFLSNYEKLFDDVCLEKLRELSHEDVQKYIGDGYTQLIVSNGWEIPYTTDSGVKSHLEGGIILRFKKIQDQWKLFSIDSMR